jgi:hypothetical protein
VKVQVLDEAAGDLADGYRFYERQAEGLGEYFLYSLWSDIHSLESFRRHPRHPRRLPPFAFQALPVRRVLRRREWSGSRARGAGLPQGSGLDCGRPEMAREQPAPYHRLRGSG